MSMKLTNIIERVKEMDKKNTTPAKTYRKKRLSVMQAIYALYVIETIDIIALVILWFKVFFLHKD